MALDEIKVMTMSRRRMYLLAALLLPTTLGIATFVMLKQRTSAVIEEELPMPAAYEAAPLWGEEENVGTPAAESVAAPGAASSVEESADPATEAETEKPASNPAPVHVESDDAVGPARYAGAGPTEAAGDSYAWGSRRLTNLSGGGGGSRGSAGGKNSQGPSSGSEGSSDTGKGGSQGGGSSGSGGSEGGAGGTGGGSPSPNVPNEGGKHEEPNPGDTNPNTGGPHQVEPGPNPWHPNPEVPGDDEGDVIPPFVPENPVANEVPEPATIGLLTLGLLGCAARRKARK